MFAFFCNLAFAIYGGVWYNLPAQTYVNGFIAYMKAVPLFGLFNNSTEAFYNTAIGAYYIPLEGGAPVGIPGLACTIFVILSAICCISIFFIIVKAVKKLFTCFLDF